MDFIQASGSDIRRVGKSIPTRGRRTTEGNKLISNFLKSGMKYAKVIDWEKDYCSIFSAYTSLRRFISLRSYPVELIMNDGNLYLHHI